MSRISTPEIGRVARNLSAPKASQLKTPCSGGIAFFFDGHHCERMQRSTGTRIDFEAVVATFVDAGNVAWKGYYRDLRNEQETVRQAGFLSWLTRHDFRVIGSDWKAAGHPSKQRHGSNLVRLAVDAIQHLESYGEAVLFVGDVHLVDLVEHLQSAGRLVTVVSSPSIPAITAAELAARADRFIDLLDLPFVHPHGQARDSFQENKS